MEPSVKPPSVKRLSLAQMDAWKRKAAACDEALEYLRGRASNQESQQVQRILEKALQ